MSRIFVSLLACCLVGSTFAAVPSKLSWAPPALKNPVTKSIGPARSSIKLDTTKDYILKLPANEPYVGELNIYGGSNVVIIGGTVRIPSTNEGYTASRRGVYLHGQKGTIHVEGLLVTGPGLNEGFNLDERDPNCVVQLQNIHCDFMTGSYSANHADMIQSWAGPNVLRIDHFTGYSQYQGFFLLPNQHFAVADGAFVPKDWDFRYLNLMGDENKSAYMLWTQDGDAQPGVTLHEVYARPRTSNFGNRNQYLWPKNDVVWEDVIEGVPAGGDFVPDGVPGYGYVSPGYRATTVAAWAAEFGGEKSFAKRLPITVNSTSAAGQSGFPVLVRLSTAITGFRYSDFKNADGSDLLFVTDSGAILPYDIDTWNIAGESLVWVRLPSAKSGSAFFACYGNAKVNYPAPKAEVWSDHAGVWHLGEDFAAKAAQNQKRACDSSGNGFDAYGRDQTEGNVYLPEMLPTTGRLGGGRRNQTSSAKPGVYSSVESYDRLKLGGSFTFSGWYKAESVSGYPRPVSRKNSYNENSGWEVQVDNGSAYEMSARGSGSTAVKITYPKAFNSGWHHYAWVYDGTKLSAYQDGALVTSGTIVAAADNGLPLSFGSNANGTEQSWSGDYDELRLRRGAANAAAIAAEYATMTETGFLAFGSVTDNGDTPVVDDPAVRYVSTSGNDANDGFTADKPMRTLDRAVSSLDAVGGGHVYVAPGTYTETTRHVTVSSLNTYATTKEDTCIVITNAITVTGLGSDPSKTVVTKSGSLYARIFYLNHAGAKIENLTVKGGKLDGNSGKGSDGGNIWIGSAGGWVDNCTVSGGTASWTFGMGGGNIYMAGGRVSRSKISGGTVGGKSGQAHYGAGVSLAGGVLENSLISGNTSTNGAAVWAKGSAKVVNCTVVGNACRTRSGVHAEGNARVVNTVIFGNTAEDQSATADASGSFDACAADFAINANCQVVSASDFTASASGDYTAAEGSALIDAGVDYSSSGAISEFDLVGGTRVKGRGVDAGCYESDHAAVVSLVRYVSPTGDDLASGASADKPLKTIGAALRALDRLGGGEIRLAAGEYAPTEAFETVTWNDHNDVTAVNTCYVLTNAITIVGDVANPASVVIRRPAQVGGVDFLARLFLLNNAEAKLAGLTIADGRPSTCNGGNVYIGTAGGVIEDCILENGDASKNWGMSGGNVFMRTGRVTRCIIRGGKANGGSGQWAYGGGVAMGGGVLDSCLVVGNRCDRGASVWAKNDAKVVNCTIVGNTGKNVSGVHAESGCTVLNCAIFGNVSSGDTTGTAHVWHKEAGVFSHCAAEIAINEACSAVTGSPFADAAKGDYRLTFESGSRLIDAGGDVALTPAASATDLAGAKRVSGPAVDIGCYEYQQDGTVTLKFSSDRQEALTGERLVFTAEYAGIAGEYTCAWDFDGDGNADATIANSAVAEWSYPAAGVYSVSLEITAADKHASFSRQGYIRVTTASERWLSAAGGLDGFDKRVKFSLTAASTGMPIPVVLSPAIYGFSYDDFATFGNDLVFTDANGALVPHDIESWHVGGESVVWVKLPPSPVGTVFYAYYGNSDAANPPPASDFRDAVWAGYAGVWHMGEEFDAGVPAAEKTAFDSTGNGLDAAASGTANLEQMATYAEGVVGPARELQHVNSKPGAYLSVTNAAAYDALGLGCSFTFSGWYRANAISGYPRPVSRKTYNKDKNGWEMQVSNGSKTSMSVRGGGETLGSTTYPSSFTSGWNHFAWVFDGATLVSYQNGVAVSTNTINAATDNGKPLSFGNNSNGTEENWNGQLDELRLAKRPLTAEEVAAEYASMSDGFAELVIAHAATDVGVDGYTWTGGLIDVPAGQILVIEHLDIELPAGAADVVCGKTGGGTLILCGDEVFDWTNRFFYVESGEVVLANTSGTPVVGALRMSGGKVTFGAPNQVMMDSEKRPCENAIWYLGGNATVDLAGYEQKVLRIHVGDYAWNGRPSAPWTGSLLGTGMLRLGVSNSGDDRYAGQLVVHPEIAAPVVFPDGISTLNGRYGTHFVNVADVPGIDTELVFDGPYFNGRTGNSGANVMIDGYDAGEGKTYGAVAFNAPTTWGSRGTLRVLATVYANAQEGSSIGLLTNVTVESTGVLGGNGRVRTMGAFVPVVIGGRLAPGNPDDPAGRLTFGEAGAPTNVELTDGAGMSVALARDEDGDRLSSVAIEGRLKIGANVSFEVAAGRLSETRRFRVIEATGGIEGAFAETSLDIEEYVARLEYGETEGVSWVDVVIEEAQPVFYDPSGAEVVDTGVYAWLIAQNAVQAQISALSQRQFDEAYLLNLELASLPTSGSAGTLAITSVGTGADEVTVTVSLDRSAAGVAADTVRPINGRLRLSGTDDLSMTFTDLATAEVADDDFSSSNETTVVFPIPAEQSPRFFRAVIVPQR